MSQHNRVHGARARTADTFDPDTPIFQQAIKDAPGKRPVRAKELADARQFIGMRLQSGAQKSYNGVGAA